MMKIHSRLLLAESVALIVKTVHTHSTQMIPILACKKDISSHLRGFKVFRSAKRIGIDTLRLPFTPNG